MPQFRVLVIDDEPLVREGLRTLAAHDPDLKVVAECKNGREAVDAIRRERPDLVFLDIQMPGLDGFEVVAALEEERPYVVFVTAFDEYAVRAFEVNAVDYLLKPFSDRRFRDAVLRFKTRLREDRVSTLNSRLSTLLSHLAAPHESPAPPAPPRATYLDRIPVKHGDVVKFVPVDEIEWIEAAGNYVLLHVGDQRHMLLEAMQELEAKLDPARFLRIHRSRIVNLQAITALSPQPYGEYELILRSGARISSSRSRSKQLAAALQLDV